MTESKDAVRKMSPERRKCLLKTETTSSLYEVGLVKLVWLQYLSDEVFHRLQEVQLCLWKQCGDSSERLPVSCSSLKFTANSVSDVSPTSCLKFRLMWSKNQFQVIRMNRSFAGELTIKKQTGYLYSFIMKACFVVLLFQGQWTYLMAKSLGN